MTSTTATTTHSSYSRVWMITGASRGIGARIAEAALAPVSYTHLRAHET